MLQIAEREAELLRLRQLQAHPVLAEGLQSTKASTAARRTGDGAQGSHKPSAGSQQAAEPRSTAPAVSASQAADAFLRSLEVLPTHALCLSMSRHVA